jgi:hypothetical protein
MVTTAQKLKITEQLESRLYHIHNTQIELNGSIQQNKRRSKPKPAWNEHWSTRVRPLRTAAARSYRPRACATSSPCRRPTSACSRIAGTAQPHSIARGRSSACGGAGGINRRVRLCSIHIGTSAAHIMRGRHLLSIHAVIRGRPHGEILLVGIRRRTRAVHIQRWRERIQIRLLLSPLLLLLQLLLLGQQAPGRR